MDSQDLSDRRAHLKRSCTLFTNHSDEDKVDLGVKVCTTKEHTPIQDHKNDSGVRNVYCIPMECADPVPCPDSRLKDLLSKYGLKAKVNFTSNLTPAKIRENISRAFSKTFSLRNQELLHFDYLSLSADRKVLTKPQNMHFDSSTIFSFSSDDDVFILLRQSSPAQNINWQQLLQRENHINSLAEDEYREIMLSVMYRLSSGKHKNGSTKYQQEFIESLLDDYKLNSYHQLVHTAHGLQQLVLFTEKRRYEAFLNAHSSSHLDAEKTYDIIFKTYYWRGMEEWIAQQVKECVECLKRNGQFKAKISNLDHDKSTKRDKVELPAPPSQDVNNSVSSLKPTGEPVSFCSNSMQAMYELQKTGTFCDFAILLLPSISNGLQKAETFNVHRVVLAAISSRIRDIPKSSIKIGGNVTVKSLMAIIEYAYFGKLTKVQELSLSTISQISNTALALNVTIDDYLKTVRPDFVRSSAKVLITKDHAKA